MARQKGHIKYIGTLGEVRHFKIKSLPGFFAGLKGGPTGEQVLNDSEFQRTRENMNEFGGCALAGKAVRVGLSQLMKQMSDSQVTGRLTAIMKKINLEDQSEARGYRAILISTQQQYLNGFAFDKHTSFDSVFYAPFTVASSADRITSVLTVPAFTPVNSMSVPTGATHFRLINAVSVVSDYAYNEQSKVYEPVDASTNELSHIEYSKYLSIASAIAEDTVIKAALPGTPTMTADVSVLNSIGIEFYQQVGTNYYLFNSSNALKIQSIF